MGKGKGRPPKQQQQQPQAKQQKKGRKAGDWQKSPEWKQFGAQLEAYGMVLRDTEGDGNCLFRSLSDQLYRDESRHAYVRQCITAFMLAQPEDFAPFLVDDSGELETIQDYCARMQRLGVWGGNLELVAATRVYQRHIVIHRFNEARMEIRNWRPPPDPQLNLVVDVPEAPAILHVAFYDGDHYASVRAVADRASNRAAAQVPPRGAGKVIGSGRFLAGDAPASRAADAFRKKVQIVTQQTGCKHPQLVASVLEDADGDLDAAVEMLVAIIQDPEALAAATAEAEGKEAAADQPAAAEPDPCFLEADLVPLSSVDSPAADLGRAQPVLRGKQARKHQKAAAKSSGKTRQPPAVQTVGEESLSEEFGVMLI